MTILALEFSSERRSVALARNGAILSEAVQQMNARGTSAFGLVEQVLSAAKVGKEEVKVIAVGLGPGSYTGIRAAIAVAQGWRLASGVKLLGISSAEAVVEQAQAEKNFGRVNVVIDAQRGEFYLATWEISATERREIAPLKIVPAAEINSLANNERCLGSAGKPAFFPTAAAVARLASGRGDFVSGEALEPIYLRETRFVKTAPPRVF